MILESLSLISNRAALILKARDDYYSLVNMYLTRPRDDGGSLLSKIEIAGMTYDTHRFFWMGELPYADFVYRSRRIETSKQSGDKDA